MGDDVGKSKLMVGILNSADIGSTILSALSFQADVAQAEIVKKAVKDYANQTLINAQIATRIAMMSGYEIIKNAIPTVKAMLPPLIELIADSTLASKNGWNLTATILNEKTKLFAQTNFLDTYTSIIFDIPESIMRGKAMEWYLSAIRPSNPSEGLVIEQYTRGHMTATQAGGFLAIKGVPDDMAMWLYDSYEKYPSIRELVLASEWMAITDAQLLDAFKYNGITLQANKTFYLNYLHSVQLKAELNAYLGQLKADYNAGLMTETELTTEITAHKPNPVEATQIIINCNKQRTRTLLNMEVQSLTWLYRKGIFGSPATDGVAELAFYYALTEIGIDDLFANGIARFESCKLGYNWEKE